MRFSMAINDISKRISGKGCGKRFGLLLARGVTNNSVAGKGCGKEFGPPLISIFSCVTPGRTMKVVTNYHPDGNIDV